MDHCVVGVQILHQLVLEMNQAESMRSLAKHRKIASSFRDKSLYDIFTLSCTLLRQINVRDETQVCNDKLREVFFMSMSLMWCVKDLLFTVCNAYRTH